MIFTERYGTKNSKIVNVLTVLAGALLLGFLWRMRGEHGWGSSWGLLNAGFVFTLFLSVVAGARQKMNLFWVSLTGASFMLTTPSWGTLLNQITGVMDSIDGHYEGMVNMETTIHPASGVAMMLMMGFGLSAIFGIMLGRGLSDKSWKWWHFVVLIAVLVGANYLALATIAHPIVRLIQPESVASFEQGLKTAGVEYDSVYKLYLAHFNNLGWAKKIGGGRNYFSELQAVAATVRAVAAILVTRFVVKDKKAAKFGALSCGIFAVAITLADIIFFIQDGGYLRAQGLAWPQEILGGGWGCWEYMTGFLAGGALTLSVLRSKKTEDVSEDAFAFLPEKLRTVLAFVFAIVFAGGVNLVRPVLERLNKAPIYVLILGIVAVLAVYVPTICVYLKKYNFKVTAVPMERFAPVMVATMTLFDLVVYMVVATEQYRNLFTGLNVLFFALIAGALYVAAFTLTQRKKA